MLFIQFAFIFGAGGVVVHQFLGSRKIFGLRFVELFHFLTGVFVYQLGINSWG